MLYLAAVGSLLVRLRRSSGIERQQLKWVAMRRHAHRLPRAGEPAGGQRVPLAVQLAVEIGFFVLGVLGVPTAVAVAILRYRLYDIDRIINRTVVYGILTTCSARLCRRGLVLGQLFGRWAGATDLGRAGATLTVRRSSSPPGAASRRWWTGALTGAATTWPRRSSLQRPVRDELDLDMLSAELLAVVDQTVQPAKVSLWLRPPTQLSHRTEGQGSFSA